MTHIPSSHTSTEIDEVKPILPPKTDSIEFTLVRDTKNKVTRVMGGKSSDTEKSFQAEGGVSYHYTRNIGQFSPEQLESMKVLGKNSFDSLGADQDLGENAAKIMDICAQNKKELTHTEDIILADFTIGDRMEAHTLPKAHITCHSLLTCEVNNQLCAIYIIEGTTEKPVIAPFTTGGHVAVTPEIRSVIESREQIGEEKFLEEMFGIIRGNMIKEIEEETGISIDPESITYFQADKEDPKKTFIHIPENFTRITKRNEEYIHIFHTHLSKEQVAKIVADKNDGVEGHVAIPLAGIENILEEGGTLPLYGFDGKPFSFHGREKFASDAEFQAKSHLIDINDLNQEIITYTPNYISLFTNLVKKNIDRILK